MRFLSRKKGTRRLPPDRTGERRHPEYLLFWPAFGLRYLLVEYCVPVDFYHSVHCALDDRIPFLEIFIIPYLFWHISIIGMHLWLYFHDSTVYRQYTRYLMVSMGISTAAFILYPTCQNLRPEVFPRDNLLTDAVRFLYRVDTNTNVCPSEHVIGSVGFLLAACHSEKLRVPKKRGLFTVAAVLTAVATVFLKQHSLVDVAMALPVCAAGWFVGFHRLPAENAGSLRRRRRFPDSSSA